MMIALCMAGGAMGQSQNMAQSATAIKDSLEKGSTLFSSSAASSMRGDFSLDVSEDFAADLKLKLSIPNHEQWSLVLTNRFGSTNKYTPLLSDGKWAIDNTLGMEVNWHIWNPISVFDTDLQAELSKMAGDESKKEKEKRAAAFQNLESAGKLSRYSTVWLSAGINWSYQELLMLKDSLYPSMEKAFDAHQVSGALFSVGLNGLHVTSTRHGIQFNWLLKYAYQLNGTNYLKLGEVEVRQSEVFTDTLGRTLTTSGATSKGRRGVLDTVDVHTVFGELHAVWRPSNKFGVDFFVMPTLSIIGTDEILNVRSGINFAVPDKEGKSLANIGLAVDVRDATTPFADAADRQDRIIPMLMVGVPIPDFKKK